MMLHRLPSIQEIGCTIDSVYAAGLRRAASRLSGLQPAPSCRKFVVNRMGSTGSTWVAKLLNSHPDVCCSHEGVVSRVFPNKTYTEEDIFDFLEALAADTSHGAYSAIGDVGSLWAGHAAALNEFTTAILVRHPARVLWTRLATFPVTQAFSEIPSQTREILSSCWGIDLEVQRPLDRMFLHDLVTFASQTWVIDKIDLLIRIEDLAEPERAGNILSALTGVEYPDALIVQANQLRVNRRAPNRSVSEIVASFSTLQREWYEMMLADAAPFFGYDPVSEELTQPAVAYRRAECAG